MAQDTYKSKHLITVSEGETMAILEGSIAAGRHDAREIAKSLHPDSRLKVERSRLGLEPAYETQIPAGQW